MSKNRRLAIATLVAVPTLAGFVSLALFARKKFAKKNEEVALEESVN